MDLNQKARFIFSFLPSTRPTLNEPLFIADPYIYHLFEVKGLLKKYQKIETAGFTRKSVHDLLNDNQFVSEKYHQYVPILSKLLNHIHNTNFEDDFWRRCFSMGLMRHLTMLYDAFKIFEAYFNPEIHKAQILSTSDYYIPVNYDEHRLVFQNSHFGQEQLLSLYLNCFKKVKTDEFNASFQSKYVHSFANNNTSANPEVGIMGCLFKKEYMEALEHRTYGKISRIGYSIDFPTDIAIDWGKRFILQIKTEFTARFDKFFFYSLPFMLPKEFVENFGNIFNSFSAQLSKYSNLKYTVSEIFIGMSYESLALAILKLRGVKIIYNEHNYSEYPAFSSILKQQTSFADLFAAHGNYKVTGIPAISSGSLFDYTAPPATKSDHILYISGIAMAKYPNFSSAFAEMGEHAEKYYAFKKQFFASLSDDIIRQILYRPYPAENSWEMFYDDGFMMRDLYSRLNVDDFSKSGKQRMAESRLIIIDYISTPHLEALQSNVPTVIIINPQNYILSKEHDNFFDELKAVGIVQTNPMEAAQFIRKIWNSPEHWWNSSKVQEARSKFLETNLGKPEYLINFLVNLVDSNSNMDKGDQLKISSDKFLYDINGVFVNEENKKAFNYTDGEQSEDAVIRTLNSVQDLSILSDELKRKIDGWVSEYHFSPERHNLLRHIEILPHYKVLELGCGCGSITRQLGETGATITAVEGSYTRACAAAARCRDLDNVKVFCSNFQDISFKEKFDVVTLIGVLEYSPLYFNSDDPIGECLNIAYSSLKPGGILIIAIENQLGLKYLAGYSEDHVDKRFFGVEGRYNSKTAVTFGKKELDEKLRGAGFKSVEFQYPFPDYKVPKAVFTHKGFNHNLFRADEIYSQFKVRDYSAKIDSSFDITLAAGVFHKNGLMEDLSNSFLIIASTESGKRVCDPDLLAAFYTTDRIKNFNTQTSFIDKGNKTLVKKRLLYEGKTSYSSKGFLVHSINDSEYVPGLNLELEFKKCLKLKDFERLGNLISLQLQFIENNGVAVFNKENKTLSEIKPGYIDCIPSNLILKDNKLYYIDQEWMASKQVSLGALIMRTVDAISQLDPSVSEISRENLIFSLNQSGYKIDNEVLMEYGNVVSEIVTQVYTGIPEQEEINKENDPVYLALDILHKDIEAQKKKLPQPVPAISRLHSHLEQMLNIFNGETATDNYYEKIRFLGPADQNELNVCEQIAGKLNNNPAWRGASEFTDDLIVSIKADIDKQQVEKANPFNTEKFFYGDSFKNFICPNPFLYAELRQNGDVAVCCYLHHSMGNIKKQEMGEIWNSSAIKELRRSILSGEFTYCDKSKCAAMQEALYEQKKDIFNYQLPYRLLDKSGIDNKIISDCITNGFVDNISAPEIISFEDDPSCNLSCPSCRISVISLKHNEIQDSLELQKKMLDSLGQGLKELWLCGAGDPFAAASYRKLLQKYDFEKFPELRLRLDTNGVLFNRHTWDNALKNLQDKISLVTFSIDAATEETYRIIRRGGDFNAVLSNMQFISGLPQRKNGMGFIIRMIVQQKNFREMKKFIELGKSVGADSVVFSVIQNWGTFSDAEYNQQAVHLPGHPLHNELREMLMDPIFTDKIVDPGNLTELLPQMNRGGSITKNACTIPDKPENKSDDKPLARVIAFYLPQYHPIPENDQWWGKGFTEWTNVTKAKPLYQGHYQPHLPSDLGYYDLRIPEARKSQAELAKKYGIEAFCYWHYWFAGHRLLERPFNDVVKSGEPDFPFCLGWANQTWTGIWHGAPNRVLIEQSYPGIDDYKNHFYALLEAFADPRYLRINGKLVFLIYNPVMLPYAKFFTEYWQELAIKEGLRGFHFIGHLTRTPADFGCQSCVDNAPFHDMKVPLLQVQPTNGKSPRVYSYSDLVKYLKEYKLSKNEHPLVFPNWDNTPRSGANGIVLHDSTPELFKEMMVNALEKVILNYDCENRLIFVKAWNEWAEGNHLEPDALYGHRYLEVIKETIFPKINS